ncbi:MAG: hypothetical protein ACJ77K_03325 [Bacteroidia bacterium]
MNKKKAIEILKKQKEKLPKDDTWVFQTASYIKDFFGEDSVEFNFISQFTFTVVAHSGTTDDVMRHEVFSRRDKALRYLDNCIEIIETKGLHKKENKYIAYIKEPANLFKIVGAICTTAASIGLAIYLAKR